ncbi:MAG: sugar phosphate isomerase/epimerase [Planctomycetota bacterium]
MKLSVCCGPLTLKQDFPGMCQWLAANGFDAVDMTSVDAGQKKTIEQAGLSVGSFSAPSLGKTLDADETKRKEGVAALKGEIKQAADLGLKTLFVCFVPVNKLAPRAATFEIWKSFFPEIVDLCESLGINIAMEAWPGPPPAYPTIGCTPEMWRAMFEVCPSTTFGLCYDPSHLVRLGIDHIRVLKEFGERIHHVHGKDCAIVEEELYIQGRLTRTFGAGPYKFAEGWWRYCVPGDGLVKWREVIAGLLVAGKEDICVSVELEDHFYAGDAEKNKAGLLASRDYLKTVMR